MRERKIERFARISTDRNRIVMESFFDAFYTFSAFVKSITYLFSMIPQGSNPILTAKSSRFSGLAGHPACAMTS